MSYLNTNDCEQLFLVKPSNNKENWCQKQPKQNTSKFYVDLDDDEEEYSDYFDEDDDSESTSSSCFSSILEEDELMFEKKDSPSTHKTVSNLSKMIKQETDKEPTLKRCQSKYQHLNQWFTQS